ncbi:regulator of Vps4 activity in the MVB pathway-domain-containing protein [Infundibulicybe gibba]|nr:regulator of Vps4 activity in the MVB pathway-domain-containing protein [Infundibulicybe gibba]
MAAIMTPKWDSMTVKAQLRFASQKLGQLQEKKDSQSTITRRDIATLLQQRHVALARAKAQKLIQDEVLGDILEMLEMHIGVILEHFNELEQRPDPTPVIVEAASSIIFAAPSIDSKDLKTVRDILVQRFGPDFARSASGNRDNHVSQRVVRALSAPTPSAANIDNYLQSIAENYGVKWSPEPRRQDLVNSLSELLDPDAAPITDFPRLRKMCSNGIPDEPQWLRPRVWKVSWSQAASGTPVSSKAAWKIEVQKQRDSYYDLIRRLLEPFSNLPTPTTPPMSLDSTLLSVYQQLSRVPPNLFSGLEDQPDASSLSPLDDNAGDDIRIPAANNLDVRLRLLQEVNSEIRLLSTTPEIRVESETTPEISVSSPDSSQQNTLVYSKVLAFGNAHQRHSAALLRLLYMHAAINPGNLSPHLPSLLIPLYTVLNCEIEPEDIAHLEADTFWLFETMVGEFCELEDEDGGIVWPKKFSERLAWADGELSDNLHGKGLDPALPHYSYRWLAPVLSHTLPLPSVFLIWDAIFSRPMRQRDANYKLEYLVDVCTSMLLRAKPALFRLGKDSRKSPGLWDEATDTRPPSPLPSWQLGDAFSEGMSLLQFYPVEMAGGIDGIIQTASDLSRRREERDVASKANQLSLGERLKVSMWKGFTNQVASPEDSPEGSPVEEEISSDEDEPVDDGNETETPEKPAPPGLTSLLATTVWRGITNQTSMEPPPSPVSPLSPAVTRSPSPSTPHSQTSEPPAVSPSSPTASTTSSLWGYAEKLKDSDTAATLAKVRSNWRAKAILSAWGRRTNSVDTSSTAEPPENKPSLADIQSVVNQPEPRISSILNVRTNGYSPPPRPAYFRPPRDSVILPSGGQTILSPTSATSTQSEGGFISKTRHLQESLASLTRAQSPPPAPKSAPRPLLLNSSSLMITGQRLSRSATNTPAPRESAQWADVYRNKVHHNSHSSISSLSPSEALGRRPKAAHSEWESDTDGGSRRIPLNRKSISPLAPGSRTLIRPMSGSSSATSSEKGLFSPSLSVSSEPATRTRSETHGWGRVDFPNSPPPVSPPVPQTPVLSPYRNSSVRVKDTEQFRGSVVLEVASPQEPLPTRKPMRKKTPPTTVYDDTSDSSAAAIPPRSPRTRSKRYPTRPTRLHIQENNVSATLLEPKPSSANSLAVEWPQDDQDTATTPRASAFLVDEPTAVSPISPRSGKRSRKVSSEGRDARARKVSTGQRARKVSTDRPEVARESAAEEGDDEGYDDLLSAYESEEGAARNSVVLS